MVQPHRPNTAARRRLDESHRGVERPGLHHRVEGLEHQGQPPRATDRRLDQPPPETGSPCPWLHVEPPESRVVFAKLHQDHAREVVMSERADPSLARSTPVAPMQRRQIVRQIVEAGRFANDLAVLLDEASRMVPMFVGSGMDDSHVGTGPVLQYAPMPFAAATGVNARILRSSQKVISSTYWRSSSIHSSNESSHRPLICQ